jgi:hypothetical protein
MLLKRTKNSLGMGDVWRRGGGVVSKRCIDTERQKMEANMRGEKIYSVI